MLTDYYFRRLVYAWMAMLFVSVPAYSQVDTLHPIYRKFTAYRTRALPEKLFVHTDRSVYLTGETIWFKLYYVDGIMHRPLDASKVAYLEVIDQNQQPVLQTKVSLTDGQRTGSLFLPASINSGTYLVRAYTNWMKNFSPDYFFQQTITIINPFRKLGLPPRTDSVVYDAQFFPEGGNLVMGLPGNVAFRITDTHGKGIDCHGVVLDAQNDTVARFRPARFGIGRFAFTPASNGAYKAVITDAQGRTAMYPFPRIAERGYTMQVENAGDNQLQITVRTNVAAAQSVYLLIHTRQVAKIAQALPFQQQKVIFRVKESDLGEGTSHLTVFNENRQPVCERLYFRKPAQPLSITATTDKPQYAARENVRLDLSINQAMGKMLPGDLSLSVYRLDSLSADVPADIYSYLWLTSDLRGTVESPDYYLTREGADVKQAIDDLMLTHGWRRFRWEDVLKDSVAFVHVPEYGGHIVRGTVVDTRSGLPAKNSQTYLSAPGMPVRVYGARSDTLGRIQFEMSDFYGSQEIVAQTDIRQDSTYRIELDNPYARTFSDARLPAFDLSESQQRELPERSVHMQTQNVYFGDKQNQRRFPKTDTLPFYGNPDETYFLDDFTRFTTMDDVLREYVTSVMARKRRGKYQFMVYDRPHDSQLMENPMVLLDGVPVFDLDKFMLLDPLRIKRLDVMARRYVVGSLLFPGCVSFVTYRGDLAGYPLDARSLIQEYEGMQVPQEFYSPRYDDARQRESRLPDFRNLLYWSPNLRTNGQGEVQTTFSTSDQEGVYRGVVQGITPDGRAGSVTFTFDVKNVAK